jgi:small subunit ribosomal protein S1
VPASLLDVSASIVFGEDSRDMSSYSLDSLKHFLEHARQRYSGALSDRFLHRETAHHFLSSPSSPDNHAERESLWDSLRELKEAGDTVHGIVTGWNRGGLLVRWEELQGFVPASQLKEVPVFEDDASRDDLLSRWVGEDLVLKIIELDPNRNRLVFSERAALWGPGQGERLMDELKVGQIRDGVVSNVCDFGVFVDLGGIDGLIHISELSWGRVTHPSNLLQIGDEIEVYVLSIDHASHHVGLSAKRLQLNPWSLAEDRYAMGDIVEATVTNVVDFGAFVQLEEGLEGLVHISELSYDRVQHPRQVVEAGDRVRVRILRIESEKHRLSLSIKQVQDEPLSDSYDIDTSDLATDSPDASLY